ncbi:MAG: hypothetical protein AAB547_01410 [Patescibacteria group bacterium]
MNLVLHLLFHVLTAFFVGYIVWRFWRRPLISFGAAILGAVLIDLDHLIDYYIAFGPHFDMLSFIHGEQFAKNDKIYVLFHGWEYVILLLAVAWLIKSNIKLKVAVLALSLGAFFHLLIDVNVNRGMTVRSYSIAYRTFHHYEMKAVVTPGHYKGTPAQK